MSAPPPVHTSAARELLEWVDSAIERLRNQNLDEASTFDRLRASTYLDAWENFREALTDRLPYVEQGAICLVAPGVTHPSAASMLELYDDRAAEVPIDPAA